MTLTDVVALDAIIPALKVNGKKQALQELAAKAAQISGHSEKTIFETLMQREKLGSTGVGNGVAIPHGKLPKLNKLFGLFARLERPVDFEEVMALALKGDKLVRSEINRLCKYVAIAIAHIVNLFDPQCVFVNGPLFDKLPWLRDHLVARARQLALEPAFEDCQFLPTSGSHLLGAVAAAISSVTSSRVHELKDTLNGIPFNVMQRSVSF